MPMREGGEGHAAGGNQTDFVGIPVEPDGVEEDPALQIIPSQNQPQHAHPKVKLSQEEESRVDDGGQNQPKRV
jgi:hypothetical protein